MVFYLFFGNLTSCTPILLICQILHICPTPLSCPLKKEYLKRNNKNENKKKNTNKNIN